MKGKPLFIVKNRKSKNKTSEEDEDTEGHEWEKGH